MRFGFALLTTIVCSTLAHADSRVIRMATIVPEGTAWARELHAFEREVATATDGRVRLKIYYGSIAGDEVTAAQRIERDQLDAIASGGMLCERLMPTMRVLMVPGMFQTREESAFVMNRLAPEMTKEAHAAGYELLGTCGLGPVIVFSRQPIHSMSELRATKLWVWDLDQMVPVMRSLGFAVVPEPVSEATAGYDDQHTDGFLALPSAALAFQWSVRARYFTDLRMRYLDACMMVADRAFDRLAYPDQQALRAAGARLQQRLEAVGRDLDAQLLGGLFQKQGLKPIPASEAMRAEFFNGTRAARKHLDPKLIDPATLERALEMLADYRGEHPQ